MYDKYDNWKDVHDSIEKRQTSERCKDERRNKTKVEWLIDLNFDLCYDDLRGFVLDMSRDDIEMVLHQLLLIKTASETRTECIKKIRGLDY